MKENFVIFKKEKPDWKLSDVPNIVGQVISQTRPSRWPLSFLGKPRSPLRTCHCLSSTLGKYRHLISHFEVLRWIERARVITIWPSPGNPKSFVCWKAKYILGFFFWRSCGKYRSINSTGFLIRTWLWELFEVWATEKQYGLCLEIWCRWCKIAWVHSASTNCRFKSTSANKIKSFCRLSNTDNIFFRCCFFSRSIWHNSNYIIQLLVIK